MVYMKENGESQHLSFIREQFYLVPAFAFTIYKSQGQTLSHITFQLHGLTMKEKITIFSRVKDWEGLLILDENLISENEIIGNKIQDGSIEEIQRLQILSNETKIKIWNLFPNQLHELFKNY